MSNLALVWHSSVSATSSGAGTVTLTPGGTYALWLYGITYIDETTTAAPNCICLNSKISASHAVTSTLNYFEFTSPLPVPANASVTVSNLLNASRYILHFGTTRPQAGNVLS